MKYINPHNQWTGAFIPNWLLERTEISSGAKLLYARLCQHSNSQTGQCNPRQSLLAQELGICDRNIRFLIKELVENKLIEVRRMGKKKSNWYYFLLHEWMTPTVTYPQGDRKDSSCHSESDRKDSSYRDRKDSSCHPPLTQYNIEKIHSEKIQLSSRLQEQDQNLSNADSCPPAADDNDFFNFVSLHFEELNSDIEDVQRWSLRKQAIFILVMLNIKCDRNFRCVNTHLKLIEARLKSGVSLVDVKRVIYHKKNEWEKDPKYRNFLRPATLFDQKNFENYLGEFSHSQQRGK